MIGWMILILGSLVYMERKDDEKLVKLIYKARISEARGRSIIRRKKRKKLY